MRKRIIVRAAALGLVALALIVAGCSDNATKPDVEKPRYPEATTKETVIENLVLSYKDADIEQYCKLLHEDYVWFNQPYDVTYNGLPASYTRAQDSLHTGNIFLAAKKLHPNQSLWLDVLELDITGGSWQQIAEFNGDPCADCWETTREYALAFVFTGGAMTLTADDLVKFTIVGENVGGQNVYRIIKAEDWPKP
jgi:hypothetical protein